MAAYKKAAIIVWQKLQNCVLLAIIAHNLKYNVLKNKELVQKIQQTVPTTGNRASELLDLTSALIAKILEDGDSLAIQGFGTFEVKKKEERVSVNPSTGSRWMIPPKYVASFKAGTTMKEKIKNYTVHEQ